MNNLNTKCGFAVLIGKPNCGKSTLMNSILGYNLSIVTRKAQTTRNKILGILTEDNYQIIFTDTPGLLDPKYELHKFMLKEIVTAVKSADVIIYVSDCTTVEQNIGNQLKNRLKTEFNSIPLILVLNKIDLKTKEEILEIIEKYQKETDLSVGGFAEIVPVSAKNNYNIDELKKVIVKYLDESEFLFDRETLTDKTERFFVSEIIRQKVLEQFKEEIPYSVFVNITDFKERKEKKDYIEAEIIVERESQKAIIIGKRGESLRKLGESARSDIENFLSKKVYLKIFVKVRKNWKKDKNFLKTGYS
ncbi:MAG: GTPase Era [Ignavibacteria bacterium]|nr:GTPase Era [Ignavibacteria bacterium]